MIKAIKNITLGFILFILPLLFCAVIVLLLHTDYTFGKCIQWVIGSENPLNFPLSIFYFFYFFWVVSITADKIYE